MAKIGKQKTHEEFVEEVNQKSPHIKITGRYINSKSRVDAECLIHNYSWSPFANNLCRGQGCPMCGVEKSSNTQRKTHEQFVKEVALINPNIEIIGKYKRYSEKVEAKCKICGDIFSVRAGHLLEGQGCKKCYQNSMKKTHEKFIEDFYENNQNADNIVLHNKYVDSLVRMSCECKICGHTWTTKPQLLTEGHGCPICARKIAGESKSLSQEEIENRVKNANPHVKIIGKYTKLKDKIECKCLLCNNIWFPVVGNILHGSGCPFCSVSKGEIRIIDALTNMNVLFETQKTFDELLGLYGGKLSYDFYLPNYNLLIEFQGKQHYEPVDWFGGEEKFKYQQEHDKRKREYAFDNNYKLLEIPYWDFDNIEDILKRLISKSHLSDGSFVMQ